MPLPVFPVVGYSIPTVLHAVGIVLLYKAKGDLPNQRVITLNLAVAEFLYCFSRIIIYTVTPAVLLTKSTNAALHCLAGVFLCVIRFAILHVIIDRFLDIWLNLRYPIYIHKSTLMKCIILQWILGLFVAAAFVSFELLKVISRKGVQFLRLSIDMIIIVAAVSTFIYLFFRVKHVVRGQASQNQGQIRAPRVWFKLKIPLFMVGTFIAFNISSSILWLFWYKPGQAKYYGYALVLDLLGWCSDAFI